MSEVYEIFSVDQHQSYHIDIDIYYPHIASQHVINVIPSELAKVALNFPICFMKSSNNEERFLMVAVLGLEAGKNVFMKKGKFDSIYIPQHISKYPFSLAKGENGDVMMAVNSSALNDEQEGIALFNANGEPSDYLRSKQAQLKNIAEQEAMSEHFLNKLRELGLLAEFPFKYDLGDGNKKQILGLYAVDRDLLKSLGDDDLLMLQKNGMLEAIYAHLMSLGQFQRLINLSADAI
jgi:hypothetical protein